MANQAYVAGWTYLQAATKFWKSALISDDIGDWWVAYQWGAGDGQDDADWRTGQQMVKGPFTYGEAFEQFSAKVREKQRKPEYTIPPQSFRVVPDDGVIPSQIIRLIVLHGGATQGNRPSPTKTEVKVTVTNHMGNHKAAFRRLMERKGDG